MDAANERLGLVVAGTYRLLRHIGSGGSSHVFQAEHLRLGTRFAVKLLRSDLENGRRAAQRFRREARAVARLRSEHIVQVIDCGEAEDGTPYMVMELLEGEDLRSLLRREGTLPARRAAQLLREACHGLAEVHRNGLIHRDIKPENLFVCRRSGGEDWCKVLDFGVVKMDASIATAHGAIVGTVRYMAPEQLSDGASVSAATDVYALGAILYECLSGHPAHAGEAIQEVMFSVMNRESAPLSRLRPSLPVSLIDIVEQCLAKVPSERPQSVSELAQSLGRALDPEQRGAKRDERTVAEVEVRMHATSWPRRSWRVASAFAWFVAGAACVLGFGGWWPRGRETTKVTSETSRTAASASAPRAETAATAPAAGSDVAATGVSPSATIVAREEPISMSRARRSSSGFGRPSAATSSSASAGSPRIPAGQFDPANPYGD